MAFDRGPTAVPSPARWCRSFDDVRNGGFAVSDWPTPPLTDPASLYSALTCLAVGDRQSPRERVGREGLVEHDRLGLAQEGLGLLILRPPRLLHHLAQAAQDRSGLFDPAVGGEQRLDPP